MSIEDIILDHDSRGVSHLRPFLPPNFCEEAAQLVVDTSGMILIATGFYIMAAQKPETDGPPGGVAIGRALQALGRPVAYVTDRVTLPLMQGLVGQEAEIIDFPIVDDEASRQFVDDLLARLNPELLIGIERCALTRDGTYLNMRGLDITPHTAKLDYLFNHHPRTVGIGDGGNEIGMGNLIQHIPGVATLPSNPATTCVSKLIICSVSNWGGYGLVAALSRIVGRNLLPSVEDEMSLLGRTVDLGAVDGISAQSRYLVDGFDFELNASILSRLHQLLSDEGVASDQAARKRG